MWSSLLLILKLTVRFARKFPWLLCLSKMKTNVFALISVGFPQLPWIQGVWFHEHVGSSSFSTLSYTVGNSSFSQTSLVRAQGQGKPSLTPKSEVEMTPAFSIPLPIVFLPHWAAGKPKENVFFCCQHTYEKLFMFIFITLNIFSAILSFSFPNFSSEYLA